MRLIKGPIQLPHPPRACAVTNREDGDFIDFHTVIDRPEPTCLYLKREIVEEAARLCGMVPKAEVDELREQLQHYAEKVTDLQEFVDARDALTKAAKKVAA